MNTMNTSERDAVVFRPLAATAGAARRGGVWVVRTLVHALVALTLAVGLTALVSAPAQAAQASSGQFGYAKVIEPEAYLRNFSNVLHVDTEHGDADGFWLAVTSGLSDRGFAWRYQPYGLWCGDSTGRVDWNGWMNTHGCVIDWSGAENAMPGIGAATDECRSTTGHPWKLGYPGTTYCWDAPLDRTTTDAYQADSVGYICAPWEDQGLTPGGQKKCFAQTYPWQSGPVDTQWQPAPDTCTGLPENANRVRVDPTAYVPSGPVPHCTGVDLAPNCPEGSTHQACTGVATQVHTASASATITVTTGVATVSASKTASISKTLYTAKESFSKVHKGKRYSATRKAKVTRKASAGGHATVTITNGTATVTVTETCSAATPAAATACAQANAATKATAQATTAANAEAAARAKNQANAAAEADARSKLPKTGNATAAQKKQAHAKALKKAKKAVAKMIAKAKKKR